MSFLGKLFRQKKTASKTKPASLSNAETERVSALIAMLEEDISAGMSSDSTHRSSKAAIELSKLGEIVVEPLIKVLPRSSDAHYALGLIGGEKALQALCGELQTDNWQRVTAAAKALGQIGDPRTLEPLRPLKATNVADVAWAVDTAIALIERKQIGEDRWLLVDRDDPFGQVYRVRTLLDEIKDDPPLRESAIKWCRDFITAMPDFQFDSDKERGHVWAMLGTLIFHLLNPQERDFTVQCPETAYCYVQCLKYRPDMIHIQKRLEQVQ